MVKLGVTKTADKKDDYTRLQNLNALVSVIGSLSTREETLQLQRTLSFLRENDESMRMPTKSFEHCVEQVVRFHFPSKRHYSYTHWNARTTTIDPLWIRASVVEFTSSFQNLKKGLLLISGLRESMMDRHKRWSSKKEKYYQNTKSYIEELVLHHATKEQNLSVLFF